ncbi:MAG TPA: DNA gyrase subunit A [Alphaproteobacteria bacterium]|nr:DNA gyrase subunit A [Alphaproteobacteria bacterium]
MTKASEIIPISIRKEMESSYLDYAMSVIVSRAIPDARDGLKPVHRRIIYAMNDAGVHSNKPYRKSARIVGDVMGKYHPHGDSAIYDSLVRMAQDFSMRLPLVDGQGNFGSMDGDSPAAMRYTESRMAKVTHELVADIEKETVDFQDNYDGSEKEPVVLPAKFPNLLVNGSSGIAVGMATNIPPHNLGEVIDATIAIMERPDITLDELTEIVPAPDFPTGGIIMGRATAINALQTGRGSIVIRGAAEIIEQGNKQTIIISEVPYQVNKAVMIEKISALVREKKIEGISELRDESDKEGVRVVIELKRDAVGSVVLNQLYKFTPLQTSFGVNLLALDHGRPKQMNLKDVLESFIKFRKEVVTKRIKFDLNKARERAHILVGLSLAVANIDEVISIIRTSADVAVARERLMAKDWPAEQIEALIKLVDDEQNVIRSGKCKFTDAQAKAILEMRLARLTGLEQEKLTDEIKEISKFIEDSLDTLGDSIKLMEIIRKELAEIKENFATPRKTKIEAMGLDEDIESLIAKEDMVVTVTMGGYIKRVPLSTYRSQRRGGKGRSGLDLKEEDATTQVFVANTHTPMLFFSTRGIAYKLKTFRLPLGSPQSRGRSLVNIFPLEPNETINVILALPEEEKDRENLDIIFATAKGNIRRNKLSDFESVRANGKIAIKLEEGDELVGVMVANENEHILMATKEGQALRFPVAKIRVFKGRDSSGVRGITLAEGDKVISLEILNGVTAETSARGEYLKIALEKRIELAKILPSKYSPETELKNLDVINLSKPITLETLNETGNELVATKIQEILADLSAEQKAISTNEIIEFARGEEFILTVTENGYGKRSSAFEYRITNRGGKGITNIVTSERNGKVAASFTVTDKNQIMLVTDQGKLIRCPVEDIRVAGRNTQGVTIFRIDEKEKIVSAAKIAASEEETSDNQENANEEAVGNENIEG